MKVHQITHVSNKKEWRAEITFDCDVSYEAMQNTANITFEYSTYKVFFSYATSINDFTAPPSRDVLMHLMQYDTHFVEGIVFGIQYVMFQYVNSANPPIVLNIKIIDYAVRTISRNQYNAFCMIKGLYKALNFFPKNHPEIRSFFGEYGEEHICIFPNAPYPPPIGYNTNLTYEMENDNTFNKEKAIERYLHEQQDYYEKYCPVIVTEP